MIINMDREWNTYIHSVSVSVQVLWLTEWIKLWNSCSSAPALIVHVGESLDSLLETRVNNVSVQVEVLPVMAGCHRASGLRCQRCTQLKRYEGYFVIRLEGLIGSRA